MQILKKVRDREDALASARDAHHGGQAVRYPETRSRLVLTPAPAAGIIDPGYNYSLITSH